MGCDCTKFGTSAKIAPADEATNHSNPVLVDNVARDQQPISINDTIRQAESIVIDDSQNNRDGIVVDRSIGQSDSTPLEDIKSNFTDELVKQEEHASVNISTNYPISTSVNNPMQTFEQTSIHESTSDHLSQRIGFETLNERPISATTSQREESHDHTNKLKDEIISLSNKSIVEENTPDTTMVEIKTTDSTIAGKIISFSYYHLCFHRRSTFETN
jgi:hypothetical protein